MTLDTFNAFSNMALSEISFIGGTYKEISYDIFDENGNAVDISSFTCTWALSPYGNPNGLALLKTGIYKTDWSLHNRFTVYLYSTDTVNLSGKYIQQPVLMGNPGYEFRLGQGVINIIPASGLVTAQSAVDISNAVPGITASLVYIRDNYLPLAGGTMRGTLYSNDISASRIKPITDSTTAIRIQNTASATILNVDTSNSRVGIGQSPLPESTVHIKSAIGGSSVLLITGNVGGESPIGLYLTANYSGSNSPNPLLIKNSISASASTFISINSNPQVVATDGKLTALVVGIKSYPEFTDSSSASALYVYNGWFGTKISGSSSVQVYHGIDINAQVANSGSILDNYGLYVQDMTVGKTANHAIYTNAGKVRFGDNVQIASGSLTVSSGSLTLSGSIIFTANANISLNSGGNINTDTSTGTKIATATTQKLGFWNATPVVQPSYTTSACSAQTVKTGGSAISTMSEFDGWTVPKVIKTLRDLGILA
jgi:hypothetical protein